MEYPSKGPAWALNLELGRFLQIQTATRNSNPDNLNPKPKQYEHFGTVAHFCEVVVLNKGLSAIDKVNCVSFCLRRI
jgi:hypothetical protein